MTQTQQVTNTDRIEKRIDMRAPRSRVWKAISDAKEFGAWFEMEFDAPFAAGQHVTGRITSKNAFEGASIGMWIETMQPESYFSYRWHPYAVEKGRDYSSEDKTLVEMRLEDIAGGTRLVLVESGFDRLPKARRADALRMNEGGWTEQVQRIARFSEADRIVKTIQLAAPRSRVWKAIIDPRELGAWFEVEVQGTFVAGQTTRLLTPPQKGSRTIEMHVEAIEPETLFAYRWHPFNTEPGRDYSKEEPTRVEFRLEDSGTGTKLTLIESGFAKLPTDRGETAFRAHVGGWAHYAGRIAAHVAK